MRDPLSIVKNARLTEKGTALNEKNKYVFKVSLNATKQEIKHAIKQLFKKEVVKVNTMRIRGKIKHERQVTAGKRPDWKKAIVTLKAGEKIDLT